ncbi:hypothetical protein ACDX78_07660 [Virgibacillus oceani]
MMKSILSLIFSIALFILFCWVFWMSLDFLPLARYFPQTLASIGILLSFINIFSQVRSLLYHKKTEMIMEEQDNNNKFDTEMPVTHDFKVASINFLWLISFFVLIFLFGFKIAAAGFIALFLKIRTDFNSLKIILSVVLTIGLLIFLQEGIALYFPQGILENIFTT